MGERKKKKRKERESEGKEIGAERGESVGEDKIMIWTGSI